MGMKRMMLGMLILSGAAVAGQRGEDVAGKPAVGTGAQTRPVSGIKLAQITPGKTTKAQVQALLGKPWRVVQFNDCGHALANQSDETWDYRGSDAAGSYRVHIEFTDAGVAHLVAKIPENSPRGTIAKTAPEDPGSRTMAGMGM
jgi:outer membrane protein assembly factor BamE (lipoprotein component of BamABCDE complex)